MKNEAFYENLTSREQEIFNQLLEGNTSKEIAYNLKISPRTATFHRYNIYKKLGVHSFQELIVKFSSLKNKQDVSQTAVSDLLNNTKRINFYKILVPALVIIIICSAVSILFFRNKPAFETENEAPVFSAGKFPVIYLKANRWENVHEGARNWGEHYNSGYSIKLEDIYSGSLDDLVPLHLKWDDSIKFRITGTLDKKLNNFGVIILYVWSHDPWEGVSVAGVKSNDNVSVGPGYFETEIKIHRWEQRALSEFPNGGNVYLDFDNQLFNKKEGYPLFGHDYGETIPEDIPSGAVYASISDFTIELAH